MGENRRRQRDWGLPLGGLVLLAVVIGFGWLLIRAQDQPLGPVPVAWDKEVCAWCRMHVGERGFAGQLQLEDRRVLNFDDPGCLLSWQAANPAPVRAVYLHHLHEDRWLTRDQVGFIPVPTSPMGHGLGAVDVATLGALSWEQAVTRVQAKTGSAP